MFPLAFQKATIFLQIWHNLSIVLISRRVQV